MAKLYFYYSVMNAGKSAMLLQSAHNYTEQNMRTLLLSPLCDDRYGVGKIGSRIGLMQDSLAFSSDTDLFEVCEQQKSVLSCILVDESHFLTKRQVYDLARVAHYCRLPVLAFGLRTDFKGELFEGSHYLLAWADKLVELKAVCKCGKKATMVARIDEKGKIRTEGPQIEIGGNDKYLSMCWKHFDERWMGGSTVE